jgi:acetyltransferase-like isoleucine patch superfamily enzyme
MITRGGWKNYKILLHDPKRIANYILQWIARWALTPPRLRTRLQKARGVNFSSLETVYIGTNVYFDQLRPQDIFIGKDVLITEGVKILTHYYDAENYEHDMRMTGRVVIQDNVFLGFNVIIASPVIIGEGAVVGANSVVTRDVGKNEIVGGVPAKTIGVRKNHSC